MNFINLYKIKYSLKTILQILLYPLVYLINFYLEKKNIFFLFSNAAALGDNVVTTGLISQVKTKTNCKIVLFSKLIEVFENNPNINSIIDLNKKNYLFYVLILLQGKRVVEFNINTYPYVDIFELLKKTSNKNFSKHLSEVSAPENLSKYIDFNKFKNEIFFSNLEIEKFNIKYKNILKDKFPIILPHSKNTFTPVRSWGYDNYQKLVNSLNLNWYQCGTKDEKVLDNVINYNGKTTIRELFFLVKNSSFVLSNDGSLNHIANCFNIPSFVIMSGFTNSKFIEYKNSIIISREPQIECAPCYLKEPCIREKKFCTEDINVEKVRKIIIENYNK